MNETASGMTGPQDHQATGRPAVRPQLMAIGYRLWAIVRRPASPPFNVLTLQRFNVLTVLTFLTFLTFLTPNSWSLTAENPYLSLTNRNCFQLKAPPKPPTEEELRAKQPPPPITLTGITTIFGSKKALLILGPVPGQPAKPGTNPAEAGKPQSFILCEGQREGDLEVVKIDEKAGSVQVSYAGQPATLTFKENGAKGGGSGGAPGGVPSPTGIPFPQGRPMAMPAGFNPNAPGGGMPVRPIRTEGTGTTAGADGTGVTPSIVGGIIQPGHFKPTLPAIDPVEQEIQMYKNQVQHQDDPDYPPMPVTTVAQLVDQDQQQQQQQQAPATDNSVPPTPSLPLPPGGPTPPAGF